MLRALLSECGDGQELDVAAALEQIASRASGTGMQALARAGQASDDPYADLSVADRVHARNRQTRRDARRLACDCSLIPALLGADSVLLDQGRSRRIFTGALRTALIARDRGCAFPGCDAAADCCDGHHIVPWAVGGKTELGNGVLLCPYHHRLVEPDPLRSPAHQWQITFDDVGLPVFIPPLQVDPRRRPRQHHRYQLRQVLLPALDEPPSNPLAEPSQSPNWT